MEDSNTKMLTSSADDDNFGFGFNDCRFSDRLLHIVTTAADSNDSDCSVEIDTQCLQISSIILAAKSPFFYKLFQNGMLESQSKDVTMRIRSYEKSALLDVLNFMYSNTLSATTRSDLIDVLIVADKYEVTSCIRYCIQLLLGMTMSVESALSYLELPSTACVSKVVEPLIDASKHYLFSHFKNFSNSLEDAMELTLCGLEVVLGSEGLQVDSEDDVYEFILRWVRAYYPKLEERREVLTKSLTQFICFPYMSSSKLKEVLKCPDFDHEEVSKLVVEALFYKFEVLSELNINITKELPVTRNRVVGYLYHDRLVKAVPLDFPRRVIYYNLTKEECKNLSLWKSGCSQSFYLGGRWFYLSVHRNNIENSLLEHLDVHVGIRKGSESCTTEIECAVMTKPLKKFERQGNKLCCVLDGEINWGSRSPLGALWTTLMSENNEYFIDGILHLRFDFTIVKSIA